MNKFIINAFIHAWIYSGKFYQTAQTIKLSNCSEFEYLNILGSFISSNKSDSLRLDQRELFIAAAYIFNFHSCMNTSNRVL